MRATQTRGEEKDLHRRHFSDGALLYRGYAHQLHVGFQCEKSRGHQLANMYCYLTGRPLDVFSAEAVA